MCIRYKQIHKTFMNYTDVLKLKELHATIVEEYKVLLIWAVYTAINHSIKAKHDNSSVRNYKLNNVSIKFVAIQE